MKVVVALTGASGLVYGLRLLQVLRELGHYVIGVYTSAAVEVAKHECLGTDFVKVVGRFADEVYSDFDLWAPISSSSNMPDAGVVIPCSLHTLSEVARGGNSGLVARVANNLLRLKRPLVLVIRETPLSLPDLRNMVAASEAGAIILPASPAFYIKPSSVEEMIDFIVGKVLDALGVEHGLYRRWGAINRRGPDPCARHIS